MPQTLSQSSRKAKPPEATRTKTGSQVWDREKLNSTVTTAAVIHTKSPPMVGVPALPPCSFRKIFAGLPSQAFSRSCFTILYLYKKCVKSGVHKTATTKEMAVREKTRTRSAVLISIENSPESI